MGVTFGREVIELSSEFEERGIDKGYMERDFLRSVVFDYQ